MPTYYIDPTAPTNGNGLSTSTPMNVWPTLSSNNVYLQLAGTTANVSLQPFALLNVTLGRYGTGANPVVNGGNSVGLALWSNAGNLTTNVEVTGLDLLSSGDYAFTNNGVSRLRINNCRVIGQRAGINVISNGNLVTDVEIDRVTVRNTVAVNENSGIFIEAQNGYSVTNVRILNCDISDGTGYAVQVKAAQGNSNSPLNGLRIEDNIMRRNGNMGIYVASSMTSLDEAKSPTNVTILRNIVQENGGPGMAITCRNGRNVVNYNVVERNNWAGLTGTGGLQLAGATNTECAFNYSSGNRTLFNYDGIGIYLDIASAALFDVECVNCVVRGNVTVANRDFVPGPSDVRAGTGPSAGYMMLAARNCIIEGNVSIGDGAGVVVWAWCQDNVIRNNTIIGGAYGVVMGWQHVSHNNVVGNNIIHDTDYALFNLDAVTRATTGNLTVPATTGKFTVTSTQPDFAVHAENYAIVIGTGYARITKKNSNSSVNVQVMRTLSSSGAVNNGSWSLVGGQAAGQWATTDNVLSDNTTVVFNGTGQSLSAALSGQQYSAASLMWPNGVLRNVTPNALTNSGTYVSGVTLRNGRMRPGAAPVGAYLPTRTRTPRL